MDRNRRRMNKVGHLGRCLCFSMGVVALYLSYQVNNRCDFFKYQVQSASTELLPPPYNDVGSIGYVGLFGYQVTKTSECIKYDVQFLALTSKRSGDDYDFGIMYIIAQLCGPIATFTGFIALFVCLVEWCFCSCCCSMALGWSLFLGACFAQSATFLIYGQTEFCFEDFSEDCKFERAGIYSIVAAGFYYLISVMLCCFPRPTPLMEGLRDKPPE